MIDHKPSKLPESTKWIIYFVTNSKRTVIHVGMTNDLIRTINIINNLPLVLSENNDKLNRIVYFEEYDSQYIADKRFTEIRYYTKAQKEKLIRAINPDWVDLTVGNGFEKPVYGTSTISIKIKTLSS